MLFFRNRTVSDELVLKTPLIPGLIIISVLIVGTIGYYFFWYPEGTLLDALYMTFITVTTIGFSEIHPLNSAGRIFTIVIAVAGIGSLFYILTVIMENLFIIQIYNFRSKKKMQRKIEHLTNHIILVGYGRVGQLAAKELLDSGEDFIVIDDDFEEHEIIEQKEKLLKIKGDATNDDTLLKAGIEKARGLVVTTANPATTVFVVLSAKVLNPDIFIVARADEHSNIEKLQRSGADRVVNPYSIGGQRLANLILNPNVVQFFEASFGTGDHRLTIENIAIPKECGLINKSLKDLNIRNKTGATILAVIRDGNATANPSSDFVIQSGDQLVGFGTKEQLKHFEEITNQLITKNGE